MHPFRPAFLLFSALVIGLSACSFTAQTVQEPATTMTPESPASDLVLLEDGLGPFIFGDSGNAVIDGVTATVGGWDADSADNDALSLPVCDRGPARIVSWGSLVLTFVEQRGTEVFSGWAYGFDPLTGNSDDTRGLDLTTPEGIGLGSIRADLIDAYGSAVSIVDDAALDTAVFVVASPGAARLAGKLDSAREHGSVDFLETTPNC